MPRRCVAAGCNTVSGEGYSLHEFPRDQGLRAKWIRAVKRQRSNWEGPSAHSLLCSKHFEPDSFATEGVRYRDAIGLPTKKRLKPEAIPIICPWVIEEVNGSHQVMTIQILYAHPYICATTS